MQAELKTFYDRWKGRIFLFCGLCVGEGEAAECALRRSFLAHFREGGSLSLDGLPLDLLRHAVYAVEGAARTFACPGESPCNLHDVILHLPWPHRAVFVLNHVFALSPLEAALAARLSPQEINALSFAALSAIRDMLPRKNYKPELCR